MDIKSESKYYRRNLPHWYIPGGCYFISFRLYGSFPRRKVIRIKKKYETAKLKILSKKLHKNEKRKMIDRCWKMYFYRIDKLLAENRKSPDCLKNAQIARIVAKTLEYYDREEYSLSCYCIMPNHVHTVFTLLENARQLEKIMFSIKRYTAGEANKILKRKGQFWQHESYDHIIRNECELNRIVNYVLYNPVEAGLVSGWQQWQWSYVNNRIL